MWVRSPHWAQTASLQSQLLLASLRVRKNNNSTSPGSRGDRQGRGQWPSWASFLPGHWRQPRLRDAEGWGPGPSTWPSLPSLPPGSALPVPASCSQAHPAPAVPAGGSGCRSRPRASPSALCSALRSPRGPGRALPGPLADRPDVGKPGCPPSMGAPAGPDSGACPFAPLSVTLWGLPSTSDGAFKRPTLPELGAVRVGTAHLTQVSRGSRWGRRVSPRVLCRFSQGA